MISKKPSLIVLVEETNFPFYTDLVRLEIILVRGGVGGVGWVGWVGGSTVIIILISVQLALN